jgi:small-conductance mechanosensitive channel
MPITPDTVAKAADTSAKVGKNFFARKDEIIQALSGPDFYIQLLAVSIALTLGWLVALLIRQRVKKLFRQHPPKRIDSEFILRPLALLGPLLALLFLSLIKPFTDEYVAAVDLTDTITQLCLAYALAKCIIMIVQSRPVAYFIAIVLMIVAVLRATGFIHSTVGYLRSIGFTAGQYHITMLNLAHGIVILVVVFWIAGVLSRTLESYLRKSSRLSYTARELTVKFFNIFVYFIALITTLSALGVDLTAFAVFGGALGVGVGLGLQKITANFVSGITLLMEKSIQIGDLIEVSGNTGWVRQLNIRYALIETSDGREILIPNEELISSRVTNWTHTTNLARIEIKVGIAYDADAKKARDLLLESAREHRRCLKDPEPTCWLREFGDSSLNFQLTFWIPDVKEGRNGPQSEVMFTILDKFKAAGISIPFPQREMRLLGGEAALPVT